MKSEHFSDIVVVWGLLCLISRAIGDDDKKHVLRVSKNMSVGFFEYLNQTGLHCGENKTSSLYRHDWIDSFETTCIKEVHLQFESYNVLNYKYGKVEITGKNINNIYGTIPLYINGVQINSIKDSLHFLQNVGKYELLTLSGNNDTIYSGIYTDTTAAEWPIIVYSKNGSPYNATDDQKTLDGMMRAEYVDIVIFFNVEENVGGGCVRPYFWSNFSKTDECPRPPKINVDQEEYLITYNQTVMLSCHVEAIPPALNIYWIKNGKEIEITESRGYIMSSLDNSSLIILRADHTHLGIYQCCATNSYDNVCGKSTMITGAPFVYINQTLYEYEVDKTVTLNCEFTSFPAASDIFWIRMKTNDSKRVEMHPATNITDGAIAANDIDGRYPVEIKQMTLDDIGTYQCCVENEKNITCGEPITLAEPMCPCSCEYKDRLEYWAMHPLPNRTMEEWRVILANVTAEIKKNLTINVRNTSASIRRRTSASDKRKSSESVGIVGIVLISLFLGAFLLFDILAIRHHMAQIRGFGNL